MEGLGLAIRQLRENAAALDYAREAYLAHQTLDDVLRAFSSSTEHKADDRLQQAVGSVLQESRSVLVQVGQSFGKIEEACSGLIELIDALQSESLKTILEGNEDESDQ